MPYSLALQGGKLKPCTSSGKGEGVLTSTENFVERWNKYFEKLLKPVVIPSLLETVPEIRQWGERDLEIDDTGQVCIVNPLL